MRALMAACPACSSTCMGTVSQVPWREVADAVHRVIETAPTFFEGPPPLGNGLFGTRTEVNHRDRNADALPATCKRY